MREISVNLLQDAVAQLCLKAAFEMGSDVEAALRRALETEPSPTGQACLSQLLENGQIAGEERIALCQDTGMAVLFAEVGQDAHIVGGDFEAALHAGVRQGYQEGFLRKSVVTDPLFDRKNTGDNTPAVIHTRLVPGDRIHLLLTAKGFGSENMSRVKMLVPADGVEGVKRFVVETVREAGPNPCPPIILGIGIGGTLEQAALMAKRCTARPIDRPNADPRYAALEAELLEAINKTGVGPAGIGGRTTCLGVNIDFAPTHLAGMPVAVNVCCHAARHAECEI